MDAFDTQLITALRAFQDECVRLARVIADDAEQELERMVATSASSSVDEAQDSMARMHVAMSRNVAAQTLIDAIGAIDVEAVVRRSTQPPNDAAGQGHIAPSPPAPPLEDNEDN